MTSKSMRLESQIKALPAGRLGLDANPQILPRPVRFMTTGHVRAPDPVAEHHPPRKVVQGVLQKILQSG